MHACETVSPGNSAHLLCSANDDDVPNFIKNYYFFFHFYLKSGRRPGWCVRIRLKATFLVHYFFYIHLLVFCFISYFVVFIQSHFSRTISQHSVSVGICKLYVIVCGVRSFNEIKVFLSNRAAVLLCRISLPENQITRQPDDASSSRQTHTHTDQRHMQFEAIDMSTAIPCLIF